MIRRGRERGAEEECAASEEISDFLGGWSQNHRGNGERDGTEEFSRGLRLAEKKKRMRWARRDVTLVLNG